MTIPAFGSTVLHTARCVNSLLWAAHIASTTPHGTLLLADHHDYACGRMNRVWSLYPGQVLLTYIIKPDHHYTTDHTHAYLLMSISNAMTHTIRAYIPTAYAKWPNDIMIMNQKVCGTLMRPLWSGSTLEAIILGIGINHAASFDTHDPHTRNATSMHMHTQVNSTADMIITYANTYLTHAYQTWLTGAYDTIYETWVSSLCTTPVGAHIELNNGIKMKGEIIAYHRDGSITFALEDSADHHIIFFHDVMQIDHDRAP